MLEAARQLYTVAPSGFIAARNQLAKTLKAAGNTDEAATVAALRRPRLAEWALNRLAATEPVAVHRFGDAIAAAQRAQADAIGGHPTALRAATNELREALNALADAAVHALDTEGASGEGQRDDVTAILRQLVANADPTPLLAGVVGSEAIVSTGEFFPGAPEPAARPARSAGSSTPAAAAKTPSRPPAPPKKAAKSEATAAAERAMARAERLGLSQRQQATSAEAEAAEAALEAAQATLLERRRALKEAKAAAAAARAALADFDAAHPDLGDDT